MATLVIILDHILLVIVNLFKLYLVLVHLFYFNFDIRLLFGLFKEDLQTAGRNILRYFNNSGRIIE